jgi:hypothetical protein
LCHRLWRSLLCRKACASASRAPVQDQGSLVTDVRIQIRCYHRLSVLHCQFRHLDSLTSYVSLSSFDFEKLGEISKNGRIVSTPCVFSFRFFFFSQVH